MSFIFRSTFRSSNKGSDHSPDDDIFQLEGDDDDNAIVDFQSYTPERKDINTAEKKHDPKLGSATKEEDLFLEIDDLSVADLANLPDVPTDREVCPASSVASTQMKVQYLDELETVPEVLVNAKDIVINEVPSERGHFLMGLANTDKVQTKDHLSEYNSVNKTAKVEEQEKKQTKSGRGTVQQDQRKDMQTSFHTSDFDLSTIQKIARPMETARVSSWNEDIRDILQNLGLFGRGVSVLIDIFLWTGRVGIFMLQTVWNIFRCRFGSFFLISLVFGFELVTFSRQFCATVAVNQPTLYFTFLDNVLKFERFSTPTVDVNLIEDDESHLDTAEQQEANCNNGYFESHGEVDVEESTKITMTNNTSILSILSHNDNGNNHDEDDDHVDSMQIDEAWKTKFNLFVSVVLPFSFLLFLQFLTATTSNKGIGKTHDNELSSKWKRKGRPVKLQAKNSDNETSYGPILETKIAKFQSMTVPALRDLCKQYQLSHVGGPKDDLIRRLCQYEMENYILNSLMPTLQRMELCELVLKCQKQNIPHDSTQSKEELVELILQNERKQNSFPEHDITKFQQYSLRTLQQMALKAGEKVTGNKYDLSWRIVRAREEGDVEKK